MCCGVFQALRAFGGTAMCVMRAFQTIGGGDEYVAGREMLYFECLRVL